NVEQAVLGYEIDLGFGQRDSKSIALHEVDELRSEPGIRSLGELEIGACRLQHLGHGVQSDDGAGPTREVGELQCLKSTADAKVEDFGIGRQVFWVHRRATAVIHCRHFGGDIKTGKTGPGSPGAAQRPLRVQGGFTVEVARRLEVVHEAFAAGSKMATALSMIR